MYLTSLACHIIDKHACTQTRAHTHTQSAPFQAPPLTQTQGDKRNKSNPWSDSDKSSEFHQSFEEEDKLPLSVGLGPIGPPSKSSKQTQMTMSASGTFSPPTPLAKTSPTTALNMSPQRNDLSPAAKSPLLGAAPPGLLPPPDKGEGDVPSR